jgi:tyrosine-protein kinase Etk/Wzc
VPLDLRQVLLILRRRIWLILAITAVATGAAMYVALTTVPLYSATGVIRLADTRRQLTTGLVDMTDKQPGLTADPILSSIAVMTSRAVVGLVVDSMPILRIRTTGFPQRVVKDVHMLQPGLDTLKLPMTLAFGTDSVTVEAPHFQPVKAGYGDPIEIGGLHFVIAERPSDKKTGSMILLRVEDAAQSLAGKIKAQPRENTNVIDVSFSSSDPILAQHVINTLMQAYQASSVAEAAQQARLRRQFVEAQLRENDSLLTRARQALSDFRSRQRSYSTREKFMAERADLAGLETQQQQVEAELRLYTSVLQDLKAGHARDGVQDVAAALSAQGSNASPIVMNLYTKLQELFAKRDSLTTGPWARAVTNPDVQRLDELIGSARDQMERTVQGIITTLNDRRASLAQLKTQNAGTLMEIPATDAEEAQLTEREEAYRKIADQLRDEFQKARLAEAAEVGQVEIVDRAMRPHGTIGTSSSRLILFGVLLGLFAGVGSALVAEHLNTAIRGRDDLETALRMPGLAVIPKHKLPKPAKIGVKRFAIRSTPSNGSAAAGRSTALTVVTASDTRSVAAEAYRTLRTKLLFSRAISDLKTIVVTSPFAQDGKSTIAANLATTFAQHGMRVLLIDCDLRKPTQHGIFHVACEPGLTELLAGEGLVAGTGRRTTISGLSLITAGTLPPDPAELIGSARMRTLLSTLSDSFDIVVLDTPPVLPVADASILASMADGVLLVVRAGQTDRRAAQLAAQQLKDVDARILGAVLNDPTSQVPRYDAYSYAAYYAYSGKE